MPEFSTASAAKLSTCEARLQRVFREVIKHADCSIIEGRRDLATQKAAFAQGESDKDGVVNKSRHQSIPSQAVDVMPSPFSLHGKTAWDDPVRFAHFAGIVMGVATQLGIKLRWGGDWNGDGSTRDHKLVDMPHFELID